MPDDINAKGRYTQLELKRETFLDRARECSELTLPTLIPPQGHSGSTTYPTPFQSIGARAVNNLAAKMLMALVPPNSPFFRLVVDDYDLAMLSGEGQRGEVEEALSRIERSILAEIEVKNIRVPIFEALKHLLVSGNALVYLPPDGGMRVFPLDRYVVQRDAMGNVLEIIVKETLSPTMLDDTTRSIIGDQEDGPGSPDKEVDIFTYIYLANTEQWLVRQEVKGTTIPGSEGMYPVGRLPWLALRYDRIEGESFGRGLVEQYLGDLRSLEGLTRAIVEGSAAASKVLFLVKPNSTTKPRLISKTANGGIVQGDVNDVGVLQLNKFQDFRVSLDMIRSLTERLSYAFLLNSAIQRQAERVTAQEIQYMASELENTLGGVYSLLSQEFQLPLVQLLLKRSEEEGKLPQLPEGIVRPQVITGIEALARSQDLNKLGQMLQMLQPLGPEVIAREINIDDYIDRLAASLGIDTQGLIKSLEQKQQEAQQQQQQQQQQQLSSLAEKAGPELVKQFGPAFYEKLTGETLEQQRN